MLLGAIGKSAFIHNTLFRLFILKKQVKTARPVFFLYDGVPIAFSLQRIRAVKIAIRDIFRLSTICILLNFTCLMCAVQLPPVDDLAIVASVEPHKTVLENIETRKLGVCGLNEED